MKMVSQRSRVDKLDLGENTRSNVACVYQRQKCLSGLNKCDSRNAALQEVSEETVFTEALSNKYIDKVSTFEKWFRGSFL